MRGDAGSADGEQTTVDLLHHETAGVVLQRDEQRSAVGGQGLVRVAQGLYRFHFGGRTREKQAPGHIAIATGVPTIEHRPVTNGRVDRSALRSRPDVLREHATDTRHEHLQRRTLSDYLVAQTALRCDGVPRMHQLVGAADSPDDAEGIHVVARRRHWSD